MTEPLDPSAPLPDPDPAIRRAEEALRLRIAAMDEPEALFALVGEVGRQLAALGVRHQSATIQIVNREATDFISVGTYEPRQPLWPRLKANLLGAPWGPDIANGTVYPWVVEVWRSGRHRYVTDQREPEMEGVRSLVDVPFSHGTLAINAAKPDAFSQRDLRILERLARVFSDGFQRFLDIARRQQTQQRLERTLRREEAMGRIRDRILGLRELDEVPAPLEGEWLTELRGLGLPVYRTSLQFPVERPGCYGFTHLLTALDSPNRSENPHAICPWVQRCWQTGRPQVVEAAELERAGFLEMGVCSLVEVPVPGEGSLGVNSLAEEAFDDEAVRALEVFAGLLATARQRLRDFQRLRQSAQTARTNLALQRVRTEVLQMRSIADFREVVRVLADELGGLFPGIDGVGINLIDEPAGTLAAYTVLGGRLASQEAIPLHGAIHEELLAYWRRGQVWERPADIGFAEAMQGWVGETAAAYAPEMVLDLPFPEGTLAVGLRSASAPRDPLRALLQEFGPVVSLGLQRVRDMAARDRAEEAVRQQQVRAQQADRLQALGEMATGIAHELNQPLNGIRTFAEGILLSRARSWTFSPEELEATLRDIVAQVDRMSEIIDHMRVFARDPAAQESSVFPLAEVVAGALKLIGAQLRVHGIQVGTTVGTGLPPCRGWPHQLEQVLLNLLANARDALDDRQAAVREQLWVPPPGWRPAISIEVAWPGPGQPLRLSVRDNGGGLRPEVLPRVFEPFFTTKAVGKGTGLGLAIAHGIAERHGGRLEVENRPGEGVTFTLVLPAHTP